MSFQSPAVGHCSAPLRVELALSQAPQQRGRRPHLEQSSRAPHPSTPKLVARNSWTQIARLPPTPLVLDLELDVGLVDTFDYLHRVFADGDGHYGWPLNRDRTDRFRCRLYFFLFGLRLEVVAGKELRLHDAARVHTVFVDLVAQRQRQRAYAAGQVELLRLLRSELQRHRVYDPRLGFVAVCFLRYGE